MLCMISAERNIHRAFQFFVLFNSCKINPFAARDFHWLLSEDKSLSFHPTSLGCLLRHTIFLLVSWHTHVSGAIPNKMTFSIKVAISSVHRCISIEFTEKHNDYYVVRKT